MEVTEQQPIFLVLVQQDLYYLNDEGLLFKKSEIKDGVSIPLLTGLEKKDWTPTGELKSSILQELISLQRVLSKGETRFIRTNFRKFITIPIVVFRYLP